MIVTALILISLLLDTFALRFDYGLTFGSLLLFQVALYLYRHAVIGSFYLFFLSWGTIYAMPKIIASTTLPLTNHRHWCQHIYGLWCWYKHNQFHQRNLQLYRYPDSWVTLSSVMTCYNIITHPGSFVLGVKVRCHLLPNFGNCFWWWTPFWFIRFLWWWSFPSL